MKQEDKELLLKDLSAKWPYKVKGIITYDKSDTIFTVEGIDNNVLHLSDAEECYVEDFKPYLRPMSSMTDDEVKEIQKISQQFNFDRYDNLAYVGAADDGFCSVPDMEKILSYLNAHHFDYRGLIEKGLAIEVTEDNNPYKE